MYIVSIRTKEAFSVCNHVEDTGHALYTLRADTIEKFREQFFKANRIFQRLTRPCALCVKCPGEDAKVLTFHDGFMMAL